MISLSCCYHCSSSSVIVYLDVLTLSVRIVSFKVLAQKEIVFTRFLDVCYEGGSVTKEEGVISLWCCYHCSSSSVIVYFRCTNPLGAMVTI